MGLPADVECPGRGGFRMTTKFLSSRYRTRWSATSFAMISSPCLNRRRPSRCRARLSARRSSSGSAGDSLAASRHRPCGEARPVSRTDQERPESVLRHSHRGIHPDAMPDRSYPAVQALVRRVQRVAANRPDPAHILAQTISMAGTIGMDPDVVLGILVEGAVQTLIRQIPAELQAETAATLIELLEERLKAHGLPGGDR